MFLVLVLNLKQPLLPHISGQIMDSQQQVALLSSHLSAYYSLESVLCNKMLTVE